MENQLISPLQRQVWILSLILAPLLIAISQFFWKNGMVTNTAGYLQVLAFVFWIPAFQAMFFLLKDKMPRFAVIGFLIAVYGCIGGNNFGMDGIYSQAMDLTSLEESRAVHAKMGTAGFIALFLPGGLFPLLLLVMGIILWITKRVSWWVGLILIIAGIGFPLSRIPRESLIAHIDNVLLLVSHIAIALKIQSAGAGK